MRTIYMERTIHVSSVERKRTFDAEQVRYVRRKAINAFVTGLVTSLTAISVAILVIIIGYIAINGITSIDLDFFIREPKPVGEPGGGIAQAIAGTIEMLVVGAAAAVPLGIATAIYLSEFDGSWFASAVRFALELLAGLPSIVVGVFVWALLVRNIVGRFSGLAGATALAVIMLPIVARSVEEILRLVPDTLREAGLALGTPRWRVTLRIVVPTVLPGIMTGVILSMARAAGETAPLILTTLGNNFFNFDLLQPMAAMPLQIYNYALSPYEEFHRQAFAASMVLVAVIAVFSAAIRFFTRRSRYES
jgi:phosphate transport system permease protein